MICRYYGEYIDFEEIRRLSGVGMNGVNAQDIIYVAEKLGLRSNLYSLDYDELKELMPLPCLVHWDGNHFVVVYKVTKNKVYVADPAKGYVSFSPVEFKSHWFKEEGRKKDEEKGYCIGCEPTIEFKKTLSSQKPNGLEAWNYLRAYIAPYRIQIVQIAFLLVLITILSALIPIITQSIIDSGITRQDHKYIDIMLIGSISLGAGIAMGKWLQQSICLYFAVRVKISLMADYISRLFKMTLSFFESRTIGTILQRNYDFDRIESFLLNSLFFFILSVSSLAVFGVLLFIYNKVLFWIFTFFSLSYCGWVLLFWAVRKKMDIKFYTYLADNESRWIEFVSNVIDVKNYSYGYEQRKKWEKTQTRLFKTRIKLLNVDQLQNVGTNLIASIRDAILIFVSAEAVIRGDMSLGMLGAVLFIVGQLKGPLDGIVGFIVSWQLFQISFSRVSDMFKAKAESESVSSNDEMLSFDDSLTLKGITFKYSPGGPSVLNSINFTFPSKSTTALVGASGSGKSTLIKILSCLYEPNLGNVCLGNLRLNSLAIQSWRNHIGVLTQESSLVKDTIANNISFGREFDQEKVKEAVRIANVKWEIESMPLGYETVIGENGRGVSEGQKQRILLARAVYDRPAFLFLDEMTSSLDARNENMIMASLRENLPDTTIIIAAHRLSTIRMSDYICVLKSGYLVESGTHERLLANRREYFNLCKSQLVQDGQE